MIKVLECAKCNKQYFNIQKLVECPDCHGVLVEKEVANEASEEQKVKRLLND